MKEVSFIISVNDTFCTWEYEFHFPDGDNMSINTVVQAIKEKFNGEILNAKNIH
jgi:hypothetical protein